MKTGGAFLALLVLTCQPSWSEEVAPRWDCFCEKRPCKCTPMPDVNPDLCNIRCPPNTKFVPNCSCEIMSGEEQQRTRQRQQERLERARLEEERRAKERAAREQR